MIAALPMYDFFWMRAATDRFWAKIRDALRAEGIDAPERLTRDRALMDVWTDKSLLLGQTCGYPFWAGVRRKADVLGAPIYGFPGCLGPTHRSFLVARRDDARAELADFRGARAAVNGFDSNTGMNLFRAAVAPLAEGRPFFSEVVETGAHALSLAAIAENRADVAAIDCVSYALLARGMPELIRATKILGETAPAPALPFIVSRHLPPEVRSAVRLALRAATPAHDLGLSAVAFLNETAYAEIEDIEREAAQLGYPALS
jgi:ABC-type phosphate/phosphonate transport system substrate-binding protein